MDYKVGVTQVHSFSMMRRIQQGLKQDICRQKDERDLNRMDAEASQTLEDVLIGVNQNKDFKFTSYAPFISKKFRNIFGIKDIVLSSLTNEPLRELSNPGASKAILYMSHDQQTIIKTVSDGELKFLLRIILDYYMYLNQNPHTLLPKFYGQYRYQRRWKNICMVVMKNLLPSSIKMHEKYDLKGSIHKRKASAAELSKSSPTLKDLDFREKQKEGIFLESHDFDKLIQTIQRDCRFLQSCSIMEYSLLLGIHNLDEAVREEAGRQFQQSIGYMGGDRHATSTSAGPSAELVYKNLKNASVNRQNMASHSPALGSIQAASEPLDIDGIRPILGRNAKGDRLLLFVGFIDILQDFGAKKKIENFLKSTFQKDASVKPPTIYAERFLNFLTENVFKKLTHSAIPTSVGKRQHQGARSVDKRRLNRQLKFGG